MEKMRIVVLADLPADTRHNRKVKREFEELLFKSGFSCLQEGVFTRIADGRAHAQIHERRLVANAPDAGHVRFFTMTERQFQGATLLAGEERAQECEVGAQLDIFL